uniref:LCP family glycopolymer transferase n=2 Tax=Faecalibacterium TaxID=216851 RepID=UPI0040267C19
DALGGVDVYSDQAFTSVGSPGYYDPTTFVEGWNHLDGKAALAFARERHAFASGDIQRGINQMKVIDAMLNKIKSPALLMGFSKIMDAAADCFVTSFSQDQISALVRMQLSDFAEWDIESYTVTGTSSSSTKCYSAKGQKLYVMKPDDASVSKAREMIASVLGGEGTVADTTQKPEKTDVFTPTTDPNAAVSEVPAESVPEEVPADSLPEETVPADQPADTEQPADTQPQEPEAPAEGEPGSGDTAGEAPSISLPTQEEVEQAASSIYNAASSIWGAIQDAASQQNDAA